MTQANSLDERVQRRSGRSSTLSAVMILVAALVFLSLGLYLYFLANETLGEAQAVLSSLTIDQTILEDGVLRTREIEEIAARVEAAEARALDYLGLYEALGFALTLGGLVVAVIGAVAATFGLRNYNEIVDELDETRKKYEQAQEQIEENEKKSAEALREISNSREDIKQEVESGIRADWEKSHLALSLIHLAQRQYELGNVNGALDTYERAISLDASNPMPYYYRGYILTQKNQLEKAVTSLSNALQLDHEFLHAEAALGYALRCIGDREDDDTKKSELYLEAEKRLKRALADDNRLIDADGESWYGSLAGLYKRTGDFKQAEFYYERAQEVTRLSSYPAVNLAILALQTKADNVNQRFAEVERLANLKIGAVLEYYWGYGDLLMAELALGKNKKALETLELLFDVIPPAVEDVLPRVHDSIQMLKDAETYPDDKREQKFITQVLARIEEAQIS